MRVVIVDDSKFVRQRLKTMITAIDGAQLVGEAGTVRDALRLLSRSRPDAVLLDLRMRDGNGFDVLRHVRHIPNAPVTIMLTNYASVRNRNMCELLGGDYFFDKSTEFEEALGVLASLGARKIQPACGKRREKVS